MQISWNDKDPIYRQLHDRIKELIVEGVFTEGSALPSLRKISADHRINPITVSKAFQLLVDEGLVEKRRGLGMFITTGAQDNLLQIERDLFIEQEWPQVCNKAKRLGLSLDSLINATGQKTRSLKE